MLKNRKLIYLSLVLLLFSACTAFQRPAKVSPVPVETADPAVEIEDPVHADIEQQESSYLEDMISVPLLDPTQQEVTAFKQTLENELPNYTLPITVNSWVLSFVKAFRTHRRENIQRALNRSVEYVAEFRRIFREYGVPEDLAYLPIIESGYRVNALSRARARGVWQFMSRTARYYGLRVDWIVDERSDPFKAAAAAARYFRDLYDRYGDWYLALAAYNGGTRRLDRAIRKLKTKDFFKIAKYRWHLRRETRNYVPAFLAGLMIAKIPEKYGFTLQPEPSPFTGTKQVQAPSPISLKDLAAATGVPYNTLKKMNPELAHEFTPFNKKFYDIRVPESMDESLLVSLKRTPPEKKLFVGWYRVRRGDSLYIIARKFGTSVRKIKRTNKLRSNLIRPGKRLLIPRS